MIFYLAGLQNMPPELEEASLLESASSWYRFRRPLTVALAIFAGREAGVSGAPLSAATMIVIAPLLVAFPIFQRRFVQSFMRTGIR